MIASGSRHVPARPTVIHPDAKSLLELAKANKLEIKMESPAARSSGLMPRLTQALTDRGEYRTAHTCRLSRSYVAAVPNRCRRSRDHTDRPGVEPRLPVRGRFAINLS